MNLANIFIWSNPNKIDLKGTWSIRFQAFRSNEDGTEQYKDIGVFEVKDGLINYDPPKGTTTTFFAID